MNNAYVTLDGTELHVKIETAPIHAPKKGYAFMASATVRKDSPEKIARSLPALMSVIIKENALTDFVYVKKAGADKTVQNESALMSAHSMESAIQLRINANVDMVILETTVP